MPPHMCAPHGNRSPKLTPSSCFQGYVHTSRPPPHKVPQQQHTLSSAPATPSRRRPAPHLPCASISSNSSTHPAPRPCPATHTLLHAFPTPAPAPASASPAATRTPWTGQWGEGRPPCCTRSPAGIGTGLMPPASEFKVKEGHDRGLVQGIGGGRGACTLLHSFSRRYWCRPDASCRVGTKGRMGTEGGLFKRWEGEVCCKALLQPAEC